MPTSALTVIGSSKNANRGIHFTVQRDTSKCLYGKECATLTPEATFERDKRLWDNLRRLCAACARRSSNYWRITIGMFAKMIAFMSVSPA